MIPLLQWDMVDHLGWLTLRQFLDGILLIFSHPRPHHYHGHFMGYWIKGLLEALVLTLIDSSHFPAKIFILSIRKKKDRVP